MGKRISLCITYVYHDAKGRRPSVYRIADYYDGEYVPVDPQSFSDDKYNFSPKFLRTRPADEALLYEPILKEWQATPKYDDPERMTTESFPYSYGKVYEVIFNRTLMDSDPIALQRKLRAGFRLPEGISDRFLLVLDQDETTYTTALCRKSMLKQVGDLFVIDDNISDMLHATHCLDTFVIEKDDVFDTTRFSSFYCEDRSIAPIRLFYRYDSLPDSDGLFYLHEMSEYIPFFVTRFIKKEGKKYDLTKAQLQKVAEAIDEAAASDDAIESFFAVTGYSLEEVKQQLPAYRDTIMTALLGYDEVDKVIAGFFEANDAVQDRFISIARDIWFQSADDARKDAEEELAFLQGEVQTANKQLDDLLGKHEQIESKKASLLEEIERLQQQKTDIEQATADAVNNLDSTIAARIADCAIISHLRPSTSTGQVSANTSSNVLFTYPAPAEDSKCKHTSVLAQANSALQANLKKAGMDVYYAGIVAALIHNAKLRTNAFVVSSLYARIFANAISNSTEGKDATVLTLASNDQSYATIKKIIEEAPGKVVLIENLLDYCNEVLFTTLCRDFKKHILIFAVDNESGLSVLSKSIWNYAWLLNADVAFTAMIEDASFTKVCVDALNDRIAANYSISGYHELNVLLLKLGLPIVARVNIIGVVRFFHDHLTIIKPNKMMDALIAKLCSIYYHTLSEDQVSSIIETLPEDITNLYFEQ